MEKVTTPFISELIKSFKDAYKDFEPNDLPLLIECEGALYAIHSLTAIKVLDDRGTIFSVIKAGTNINGFLVE